MQRRALLIGVDDYAFSPLATCVADAVAMRQLLIRLGLFDASECTLMTSPLTGDAAAVPSRDAILDWFETIYELSRPLDCLFVYFAGHGLSVRLGREADALTTVLVPAGVKALKNAGGRMVDLDELVGRFSRRGAREQHWIVDACRNLPPDDVVPEVAQIGWDRPTPGDPRDRTDMAQAVLYAAAPLGRARATVGGHGVLTGHVLDGLACENAAAWGASAYYDDAKDAWLIDLQSLCEYAERRVRQSLSQDSRRLKYELPRFWCGERKASELRVAGDLPDRLVSLAIEPPEAAAALAVTLTVKRNRVAAWPPLLPEQAVPLPPERYRLSAELILATSEWRTPSIADPILDIRETERILISVEPVARSMGAFPSAVDPAAGGPGLPDAPTKDGAGLLLLSDMASAEMAPAAASEPGAAPALATLKVAAIDPGATVKLTRLSGGRQTRIEKAGESVALEEGLWRVEVMLGDDIVAVGTEDLKSGSHYEYTATARVTPAFAALRPDIAYPDGVGQPSEQLVPSETIGPMQGAILPTILPLLALKPFDTKGAILEHFSQGLAIPTIVPMSETPAAVALAFDGNWDSAAIARVSSEVTVDVDGQAERAWRDPSRRTTLFVKPDRFNGDEVRVTIPTWGTLDIAAPRMLGHCSTVAVTIWNDGRWDLSVDLFRMPLGADKLVRPGKLSRALALASRLYRSRSDITDCPFDVFELVSQGSWGDPVLGALAWFGRARLSSTLNDDPRAMSVQGQIAAFMESAVPMLTDTRVISALSMPPDGCSLALDAILDDPFAVQPILADAVNALARRALERRQMKHWAVHRFQALEVDSVFNAVRLALPFR